MTKMSKTVLAAAMLFGLTSTAQAGLLDDMTGGASGATKLSADELASVVGPLCTPLDLLAYRMALARAEVGDVVAVFQSGGYGFSASPLGFLSHPPPEELLV